MMDEKYCSFIIFLYLLFGISAERVENCTVKEHLPCTLYWGVTGCSPLDLQSRFPFLRSNDSWPGKVSSFDVNMTQEYWPQYEKYYAKGVFTFNPPQDGSIIFVKGFVVMQYRSDTVIVKCYIFDLSNATWKAGVTDFTTVFTLTLNPMKGDVTYALDIYTFPRLPTVFDKKESLSLSVNTATPYADSWIASISYEVIEKSREVRVSFPAPPAKYNFSEFQVILKNISGGAKQSAKISKTGHTFGNVTNGVYQVWVMPKEEPCGCRKTKFICELCVTTFTQNFTVNFVDIGDENDNSKSPVKDNELVSTVTVEQMKSVALIKNSYNGDENDNTKNPVKDDELVSTVTVEQMKSVALINNSYNELPTTTNIPAGSAENSVSTSEKLSALKSSIDDEEVNTLKMVYAVVGSLICSLLVGVLVVWYFCRRRERGGENDNYKNPVKDDVLVSTVTVEQMKSGALKNNSYNAEITKPQHRPKLFILYEEDHPYHRKVVDKFASYLHQHCHCYVWQVQLSLDTTWVHQEIQTADYVIIVNSWLAFANYKNLIRRNQREPEQTPFGNIKNAGINCILKRFLKEPHYDKLIMVYFDYTSEDHIITDICPGYHYMLMKHFCDLLLHIHKLKRTDNLAQYDIPLDGKYYLKPVGKDLQTAIREAADYETENPDWFAKKYGYLRSFSNASDESKFDSGFPQEPGFLNPILSHLQNFLDSSSQDAITVTPSIISNEVGRTYLALSSRCFQEHAYNNYNQTQPVYKTPTTANSGSQADFIPPDDKSEFETASKTLSEQMLSINAHNFGHDNKAYDWQQDLTLLRVQSGEIRFEDTQSLGGESV